MDELHAPALDERLRQLTVRPSRHRQRRSQECRAPPPQNGRETRTVFRDLERVKFEDLTELIRADYRKNGRKSLGTLEGRLKQLGAAFSGWRAVDIGEDVIDRYAADRLAEGAPPATINRELSALLRAFNLGRRARMVVRVPVVEKLHEHNVRKGFVDAGEFAALVAELPEHARPIAQVGFLTGWRVGELLSRSWRHVDLHAGWLRLEPGETKNGQGRQFPLIPELRAVLEAQHEHKLAVERPHWPDRRGAVLRRERQPRPRLSGRMGRRVRPRRARPLGGPRQPGLLPGAPVPRLAPLGRPQPRARWRAAAGRPAVDRSPDGLRVPPLRYRR